MKIEIGNRKFVAFLLIIIVFLLISVGVLVAIVLLKSNTPFNTSDYAGLFIPLGTGLMLIGSFFFGANAVENITRKKDDKQD